MKVKFPLLASVIFVGMTSVNWSPKDAEIALSDQAVLNQHGTTVGPVLDEPIPAGRNFLWCATFQMAWDAACANQGGPIQLQPASELAGTLNQNPFDRRWIDEASVFNANGKVDDGLISKIRDHLNSPSKLLDELAKSSQPGDMVFYSALKKDLRFQTPFAKLGTGKLGQRSVPWFGFTPEMRNTGPLLKQVRVHHYQAENDFLIELSTTGEGDQLLLAKLPQAPKTPGDISRNIIKLLQTDPPQASGGDLLAIPNVVAGESAQFTRLEGRRVTGSGLVLRLALQTIDFRMDEQGAKLRSESAVSFGCSKAIDPRLMVLDPPFALILKRKDAPQPYFIAWFANADLLGEK